MAITYAERTGTKLVPGTSIGMRGTLFAYPQTDQNRLTWDDEPEMTGPITADTNAAGEFTIRIPQGSDQQTAGPLLWRFIFKPSDRYPGVSSEIVDGYDEVTTSGSYADLDLDAELAAPDPAALATFTDLANDVLALGTTNDSVIASRINTAGSLTDAALLSSGVAPLGKQSGVDPTGANECATAINTALAGFAALGVKATAQGTFKIASTVTVAFDADLSAATFNYTGTSGTAMRIGTTTSGTLLTNLKVHAPKVIKAVANTTTGWAQVAGTVGLDISNVIASTVWVGNVVEFETGLKMTAVGAGANYNHIFLGHLENNKVNMYLTANSTGSMNESNYYGGRFSHYSAEGSNVSGTRQIEMAVCTHPLNNNVFYKPSIEGDTAERHLIVAGSYNRFINGRYEVTGGARVRWASDATQNLIDGGYQAGAIVEDFVSGATRLNRIRSSDKEVGSLVGGTGGQYIYEAGSAAHPIHVIMDPGARVAGSATSTAYRVAQSANETKYKRASDSNDRIVIDHVNGAIKFGNSGATPSALIGARGSTDLGFHGHLAPDTDNTYDIGITTPLKPRYIRAGTAVQTGSAVTASRPSASTAGVGAMFYDTTLSKPIWSNGTVWKDADGTTV